MQSASADFPMDGRPATMTRLPGWKPEVMLVELAEAGRRAGDLDAGLVQLRDPLEALLQQRLDVAEVARDALLREVEDELLGLVDELRRLARALPAEPRDLAADADEPAQRRHLADDLRVVGDVRGRGDERRELVDADAAADVLELAALVQLVGERDRVDRLAALLERDARRGRSSRATRGRSRSRRGSRSRPRSRPARASSRRGRTPRPRGSGAARARSTGLCAGSTRRWPAGHRPSIPSRSRRPPPDGDGSVVNMSFCAICRRIGHDRSRIGRTAVDSSSALCGNFVRQSTGVWRRCVETLWVQRNGALGRLSEPARCGAR